MKKTLILAVLLSFSSLLWAQKSDKDKEKREKEKQKKEIERWKDRRDKTDPLQYKKMVEEKETLPAEVGGMKRSVENFSETMQTREKQVKALEEELNSVMNNVAVKSGSDGESGDTGAGGNSKKVDDLRKGVIFKVQIKWIADDAPIEGTNVTSEQADGKYKYTIGHFRDYWEAMSFRKYAKTLGLKDAFVVAYKDNSRVENIADVLSPEIIEELKRRKEENKGDF